MTFVSDSNDDGIVKVAKIGASLAKWIHIGDCEKFRATSGLSRALEERLATHTDSQPRGNISDKQNGPIPTVALGRRTKLRRKKKMCARECRSERAVRRLCVRNETEVWRFCESREWGNVRVGKGPIFDTSADVCGNNAPLFYSSGPTASHHSPRRRCLTANGRSGI